MNDTRSHKVRNALIFGILTAIVVVIGLLFAQSGRDSNVYDSHDWREQEWFDDCTHGQMLRTDQDGITSSDAEATCADLFEDEFNEAWA